MQKNLVSRKNIPLPDGIDGLDSKNFKLIGEGSDGKIYHYVPQMLPKEQFVVKVIKHNILYMYKNEDISDIRKALCRLSHRHIIEIKDLFYRENNDTFYEIMEYSENGDLFDGHSSFTVMQRLELFGQAMKGVEYLHSLGIAHRDLKPENFLLSENFKTLKIGDFDNCTLFNATDSDRVIGTSQFLPPEKFGIHRKIFGRQLDIEQDVWAMGIILFCLISSIEPWTTAEVSDEKYLAYVREHLFIVLGVQMWDILGPMYTLLRNMLNANPHKRPRIDSINFDEHLLNYHVYNNFQCQK